VNPHRKNPLIPDVRARKVALCNALGDLPESGDWLTRELYR
jgi:hypothetical protein